MQWGFLPQIVDLKGKFQSLFICFIQLLNWTFIVQLERTILLRDYTKQNDFDETYEYILSLSYIS